MSIESHTNIAVFIGTHGEEMEVGGRLQQRLQTRPIAGVASRIAHPEAVKAGVRYLGSSLQIMNHYPGDPNGNPEQQAAYSNIEWLSAVRPTVVADIHETDLRGAYTAVGREVTYASLAVGVRLGSKNVLISDSPFYKNVKNGVSIENSLSEVDPDTSAKKLYKGLQELAPRDLQQLPLNFDELIFYNNIEIMSSTPDGTLTRGLSELEAIPSAEPFSALDISNDVRNIFGITQQADVFYGTWGHNNMSKKSPEILGYTEDGVARSECFGSIYVAAPPPEQTSDGLLIFTCK